MLFAMAEHLELPRPWRLMLTAGWNLAESLGLPVAGYFVGAELGGRDAGMLAATGVVWLTVVGRKVFTRSVPGLLTISALVLTLQTAVVIVTGSMLFFLLQFPLANLGLCVLFARTAPTRKPLVAQLAAEVVALRQPSSHHPGLHRFFQGATWLWAGIFFVSTVGLAVLMAIETVKVFLLLTTAVTIGGVVAGTFLSAFWFFRVLHRFGLRVRFASRPGRYPARGSSALGDAGCATVPEGTGIGSRGRSAREVRNGHCGVPAGRCLPRRDRADRRGVHAGLARAGAGPRGRTASCPRCSSSTATARSWSGSIT